MTRSEGPMVLPRAFALLRTLSRQPQGLNLSALAVSLRVPKSSLSSTLKALTEQDILTRRGTLYFLGPEAYGLASTILAGRTIRQIARPYLEATSEETGETVLLAELDTDQQNACYIDSVESDKSIRFSVPLAARRPLFTSAAGRVFLAYMTDQQRQVYYDTVKLEKLTNETVTDRAALETILAKVRLDDLAVTMGEYAIDAAGFAVPIRNSDGDIVAALTIGVPVSRAQRERDTYSQAAVKTGAAISKILGYSRGGTG